MYDMIKKYFHQPLDGLHIVLVAGVYIKFEIHIFVPLPLFFIYIFPQLKFSDFFFVIL